MAFTQYTIWISLLAYTAATTLMLRLANRDWTASMQPGRRARLLWTIALVAYLAHVAAAFHYYHHWSHAAAFSHTERESGFGYGIYISHIFTACWAVDTIAWWVRPTRYAQRSKQIGYALHGFMLFIVINGAVVFTTGAVRWVSVLLFAIVLISVALDHRQRE